MLRPFDIAGRCRCAGRILGRLLSALLLVAVPAAAYALDFTNINWSLPSAPAGPFFEVEQTTNSTLHSILTFTIQPSSGYTGVSTESANFYPAFFDGNGSTLNANWTGAGLSALSSTGGGTVAISITVSDGTTTATMFTQNATSNPPNPATNTTITGVDLSNPQFNQPTLQVTITFTFSNFSQPVPSPSSPMSLMLDFHN